MLVYISLLDGSSPPLTFHVPSHPLLLVQVLIVNLSISLVAKIHYISEKGNIGTVPVIEL